MGGGAASPLHTATPHGEEARSAVSNHRAPLVPFILRDAAARLLRMRGVTPCGMLRHAFQKRFFRGLHRVGGSDVHPDAVEPQAEQPFLLVGAVEHFRQ